ncbi:MAG: hypothetical protein PXY39_05910 [archaeon]|nr:hypothetical protein [archaeon]
MSKTDSGSKTRAVLQLLASNGSMTSENITKECSFESRMATAGIIALLRRNKAIELIPESYRITNEGKSILGQPKQETPKLEPKTEHPKKGKPANKAFQIKFLTKEFEKLNAGAEPASIDFVGIVDEKLHTSENRELLEKAYPTFKWKKDEPKKEEPQIEQQSQGEKSS